jgi:alkanesulfonate monooxygenase SsuD/methylene tetrahydromethanopterin reductase-like flavin-dependent oxidoreductase (luciferase family)
MLFSIGGSSGLTWTDLLEVTRTAEDCGYYGFYPSDHLMQITAGRGSAARLDAPTMLACLAGYTTRLRLGTLVLGVMFRHPVIVARIFNTIDQATGGRVDLGIGAANQPEEHRLHGMYFPPLKERLARLDEALAIITGLWTQERTTFEGQYYQVYDVQFEPKPVHKPHPPIIIGGASARMVRIAARYADDWNIHGSPGEIADHIEQMKEVCKETGRDFNTIRVSTQVPFQMMDSKAEYEALLERQMQAANSPDFKLSPRYSTPEEQIRESLLAGDAEMLKEGIRKRQEVGLQHINFQTPRPFNRVMVERFAKEVMPAFA